MTTISSVSSNSSLPAARQPKKELGKEDFLQILVTQLKNQDPTQPMQNADLIVQMSQLSTLEQLSNLNQTFTEYLMSKNNVSQYADMLNKKVTWLNPETNKQESGVVTGIVNKDNEVYFKIGDQEVPASSVLSVEV